VSDGVIDWAPELRDPPPRKRGAGKGKPLGAAKQFAIDHPNRWVLARVRTGKRSGSGMLDSAHEWQVAIRWEDGNQFGVEGDVTTTYIMHLAEEARRG
jgi:hypothetical protein